MEGQTKPGDQTQNAKLKLTYGRASRVGIGEFAKRTTGVLASPCIRLFEIVPRFFASFFSVSLTCHQGSK